MPTPKPEEQKPDNLRIWNIANQTDPTHTREAKPFGKIITAIDSYYQLMRATEAFGPLGQGWGYDLVEKEVHVGNQVQAVVKLTLWYIDPTDRGKHDYDKEFRCYCGPVVASNALMNDKGRMDEEAYKKATTDALTKSLSYLGFSADIFMGLYDDAKYKMEVKRKFDQRRAEQGKEMPAALDRIVKDLAGIDSFEHLETTYYSVFGSKDKGLKPHVDLTGCSPAQVEYIRLAFKRRKSELTPDDEPTKDLTDKA